MIPNYFLTCLGISERWDRLSSSAGNADQTKNNMKTIIPLTERGTTGLLQYLASGTDKMFPARMATVCKIIQARYSDQWRIFLFMEVARGERAKRAGKSTPKLSPLAWMKACKAGDHSWSHH